MRLDTSLHLETPEGTAVELHPAGLFPRGVAYLFDELIRWGIVAVTGIVTGVAGGFGMGFFLVVLFLTYWLYGVVFEVFNNGVTPGKRSQGLKVVHDDGTPVRFPASLVRNLVLWVDLLPAMYAGAIVSMLITTRFQRLGDLAAGTLVVHAVPEPKREAAPASEDRLTQAPPFSLSAREQAVFVDYLERVPALTEARAEELAAILAPSLDCSVEEARSVVERVALGLKGE